MSVAKLHVCHCAVIKDFIYSASTGCYYFYFLYEELRTGMQANGGEKWRQFQLIISPSDILMHYYNYSRMSSKDHHTSFFRLHFSPSKNFNKQSFWKVWISEGAIPVHLSDFVETRLLHTLPYQVCCVTRASFHFLVPSLVWAFPCLGFFLIPSPMTFFNSAFSETDWKYSKEKRNSQAVVGGMKEKCWVVFFLSYKVTFIFFHVTAYE